jgi:two-component system, NtrC family, sensor kinase
MTLSKKLMIAVGGAGALICAALGLTSYKLFARHTIRLYNEKNILLCQTLAANCRLALLEENPALIGKILREMRATSSLSHAAIYDAQGRLLSEAGEEMSPFAPREGLKQPLVTRRGEYDDVQAPVIIELEKPYHHQRILGYARIEVGRGPLEKWLRHVVFRTALITGLSMLGFFGLLMVLLRHLVLRPIQELRRAALLMGEGRFSPISIKTKDEFGGLAETFTQMAESIRERTEKLQETLENLQRTQARMIQSEKLSSVGQMAAGIAHEINNPLGVILGFAQGLVRRMEPGNPLAPPLRSIEQEALRCKKLTEEMLVFSRRSKEDQETFDVDRLVEGTLNLILAQAHMAAVTLEKRLGGAGLLHAHKIQIEQVVVNLCNNAIDAMPKGGKLTVETERGRKGDNDAVILRVSDTGMGIPPHLQARIFEPFFTTKEVGKGTGLGVTIIHEIVTRHGGDIELKSEEGRGTTFVITLPAFPAQKE